jgi:hypothetical protein
MMRFRKRWLAKINIVLVTTHGDWRGMTISGPGTAIGTITYRNGAEPAIECEGKWPLLGRNQRRGLKHHRWRGSLLVVEYGR